MMRIHQFHHALSVVSAGAHFLKERKKVSVLRDLRLLFNQKKVRTRNIVALIKHFLSAFILYHFNQMGLRKDFFSLFFKGFQGFHIHILNLYGD